MSQNGQAPAQTGKQICSELCGARCCRGPAIAELTPQEVERLSRFAADRGLSIPLTANASGYGAHMQLTPEAPCVFLDQDTNLCTIYDERPERCRSFPAITNQPGCLLSGWTKPPQIAIGVPRSGERMNLQFETSLLNVRTYLGKEHQFGGVHQNFGATVDDNQNDIVAAFLETEADYLCFLEDDMTFTPNAPSMLAWKMAHATAQGTDMPILCGLYFQRTDVPVPHFYHRTGVRQVNDERALQHESMIQEVETFLGTLPIPEDNSPYCLGPEYESIMKIDTGSTGFTCVRRDVFETIPYPWFRRMGAEIGEPGGTAPDFGFFFRAAKYGFDAYGDTGIGAGHLALQPVGAESFKGYRAQLVAAEQAEMRMANA
jgi:Fe-S-cluster containining protein